MARRPTNHAPRATRLSPASAVHLAPLRRPKLTWAASPLGRTSTTSPRTGGAPGISSAIGTRLITITAAIRPFLRSLSLGPSLELSERVMSALRKRPITKNARVTIPARTADGIGRPVGLGEPEVEDEDRREREEHRRHRVHQHLRGEDLARPHGRGEDVVDVRGGDREAAPVEPALDEAHEEEREEQAQAGVRDAAAEVELRGEGEERPSHEEDEDHAEGLPNDHPDRDGPGEAALHPVSDEGGDGAPAIQGRSALHGVRRLRRLGGELEEDLVEPRVLARVGHPAEAVERPQGDDAALVDYARSWSRGPGRSPGCASRGAPSSPSCPGPRSSCSRRPGSWGRGRSAARPAPGPSGRAASRR